MLKINSVSKQFNNRFTALESIDLQVYPGEIISIVGTSGCGKSTLLRIISGLDFPTSGSVYIHDQPITAPHPEIGIIFQEPRLMPWLNVWENVQFGLYNQSKAGKERVTQETLAKVGLTEFSELLPRELSGGMAQRVAIARALVTKPSILLLDEPFSALDAFTRLKMQEHLLKLWEYDRPTMILVTHDIEEALVLSDRAIVMRGNPGHIHQDFTLNLPRPRKRTDTNFQYWRELLLSNLDLSTTERVIIK
ncbi:MAG: ABC transporter ATP-binding protein [Chroococcidiopsidaceae cyanobacterium CP_BM_ER_R8_30]|nr:ABC transporter ATP-binding protein [Chroococcidiopsidaceae cyanobacterium CP_BM_ER_R8_30]